MSITNRYVFGVIPINQSFESLGILHSSIMSCIGICILDFLPLWQCRDL